MLKEKMKKFGFVTLLALPMLMACDSALEGDLDQPQDTTTSALYESKPTDDSASESKPMEDSAGFKSEAENQNNPEADPQTSFPLESLAGVVMEFTNDGVITNPIVTLAVSDNESVAEFNQLTPEDEWDAITFTEATSFNILEISRSLGRLVNERLGKLTDLYLDDSIQVYGYWMNNAFIATDVNIQVMVD
jgi:hypothetical protein